MDMKKAENSLYIAFYERYIKTEGSLLMNRATVVERPHVWYMDEGALTKTICPDRGPGVSPGEVGTPKPKNRNHTAHHTGPRTRDSAKSHLRNLNGQGRRERVQVPVEVVPPTSSNLPQPPVDNTPQKCCACDEAKYEVIFEGIWSKETHPKDFPENEWLLHFSDIIGASHSRDYFVWKTGDVASEGIRQVAEWGATRHLENELKSQSRFINTIIKARGLWHPNERGKTSAAFRVDRNHHLMSLVSMIGPSPDWIVGISGLELCMANCTWLEETQLDLYPYDAGTDSGITYMSPNTPTDPRDKIHPLTGSDPNDPRSPFYDPQGLDPMQPFARVHIRRQRIYPKSCNDTSRTSETSHEVYLAENTEEVNRPECAVTEWTPWSACSVTCGKGLRMRKRNYALPVKADMFRCDRQLVEKEMCLGDVATCPPDDENTIEEIDSICAVTSWTEWTPCSVTCGEGTRSRHRRYKNHMGRKKCNMEVSQVERCQGSVGKCTRDPKAEVLDADCPLTPWSEWAPCSVSCGVGYRVRSRIFLNSIEDEPLPAKCSAFSLTQRVQCTGEHGIECRLSMQQAKELCSLPSETGPCRADKIRYAFNFDKLMCIPFSYGGCKGNRNRFDSVEKCEDMCGFIRAEMNILNPPREFQPELESHAELSSPLTNEIDIEPIHVHQSTSETDGDVERSSSSPNERATPTSEIPQKIYTTGEPLPATIVTFPAESDETLNLDLGALQILKNSDSLEDNPIPTLESVTPPMENGYERLEDINFENFENGLDMNRMGASGGLLIDSPVIEPESVISYPPPPKVDCVVSGWSDWSSCSVSCGTGFIKRSREILIHPQNEGRRCKKLVKQKPCRMPAC